MDLYSEFLALLKKHWDAGLSKPEVLWSGAGISVILLAKFLYNWLYKKTERYKKKEESKDLEIQERTRKLWIDELEKRYKKLLFHHINEPSETIDIEKTLIANIPTSQRYWLSKQNPSPTPLRDSQPVIEVLNHESVGGSLLILGAPGAGKTTSLIHLALDLLQKAMDDEAHPLPMLFHCSSWRAKEEIVDWLARQLKEGGWVHNQQKGVNRLKNGVIFPLLDGLDELPGPSQAIFIDKVNEFIQQGNRLVICSRQDDYHRMGRTLETGGLLRLEPISLPRLKSFLEGIGRENLYHRLEQEEHLRELAQRPLFLGLLLQLEKSLPEPEVAKNLGSEEYEALLWEQYLAQRFESIKHDRDPKEKGKPGRWVATPNRAWLSWLARTVKLMTGKTEFRLEEMQPNWTASPKIFFLFRGMITWITNALCLTVMLWRPGKLLFAITFGLVASLGIANADIGYAFYSGKLKRFVQALISGAAVGFGWALLFGTKTVLIVGVGFFALNLIFHDGLPVPVMNYNEKIHFKFNSSFFKRFAWEFGTELGAAIIVGGLIMLVVWFAASPILGHDLSIKFAVAIGLFLMIMSALSGAVSGLTVEVPIHITPAAGIYNTLFAGISVYVLAVISLSSCFFIAIPELLTFKLVFLLPLMVFMYESPILSFIQHFLLRFCLHRSGNAPMRYVAFLDRMHEARILQRVGGSYRFIHVNLREHLAQHPDRSSLSPQVRHALEQA